MIRGTWICLVIFGASALIGAAGSLQFPIQPIPSQARNTARLCLDRFRDSLVDVMRRTHTDMGYTESDLRGMRPGNPIPMLYLDVAVLKNDTARSPLSIAKKFRPVTGFAVFPGENSGRTLAWTAVRLVGQTWECLQSADSRVIGMGYDAVKARFQQRGFSFSLIQCPGFRYAGLLYKSDTLAIIPFFNFYPARKPSPIPGETGLYTLDDFYMRYLEPKPAPPAAPIPEPD